MTKFWPRRRLSFSHWNSFFQLEHNWSSSSSFQTLLALMARPDLPPQELCWPWRCYWSSTHQIPAERGWWQCLSWGIGWVLISPGMVPGTIREAGVEIKPPAVLSKGSAPQPNTQRLWWSLNGAGGKHCLTLRMGLVELPCPWRKLSEEAREGEDPITYFTYRIALQTSHERS